MEMIPEGTEQLNAIRRQARNWENRKQCEM